MNYRMNTPAIHQAMRLEKYPEEMSWLCFPDSDFPEGVSDLLRLCSSKLQLIEFANTNRFDPDQLSTGLFNFIEKAIVNESNCDEKVLGTDKFASSQLQKFHYQLLMKIYHPDLSNRPDAEYYASLVTKAYQNLKENEKTQEIICFSENRRPPSSYYQTTKKAETQISNTKTVIAIVSAVTIFSLVANVGEFFDPSNPKLIISSSEIQENISKPKSLIKVTVVKSEKNQNTEIQTIQATSTKLQMLLKDLEGAYEDGNVDTIKPILANSPGIKNQTEKQLIDKLETLFEITSERKMVLFDFNWTAVSGTLKGKGKFLSRYKLVGERKWLTREGTAQVTAEKINERLKITQLILENQTIE